MTPKLRVFLATAGIALPLDIASKEWVIRSLDFADRVPVIDGFFYLTHVRNPGAAFSMLANAPEWFRAWFFPLMGLVALALIVSFFRKLAPWDRLAACALGLILGGASGNLLDRLRHGEVVDFLRVQLWRDYSWPDFNFADSFIVIGVGLLILELFAAEGEGLESPPGARASERT